MAPFALAYYCSGHGYGHATRVDAFACHLLSLPQSERPIVHIVSSAPKHVFSASIIRGARYRYAEIDPVIVQPVAYRVDRQKSFEVLQRFIERKNELLRGECIWLASANIRCVLSDAAFLGCLAAKVSGIPSVLVTNFTFDSVFSYLATTLLDSPPSTDLNHLNLPPDHHTTHRHILDHFMPDIPLPQKELDPLIEHIHGGYRCADLLVLLPGNIPIPSFPRFPSLPSPQWVDPVSNTLYPEIMQNLLQPPPNLELLSSVPFPPESTLAHKSITRSIIPAPLIVRPSNPSAWSAEGRSLLLSSIGVPEELHDPERTKILVVSFGGQVFRKPNRSPGSRSPSSSRRHSRNYTLESNDNRQLISPPASAPPDYKEQLMNGTKPGIHRPAHTSRISLPDINDTLVHASPRVSRHQRAITDLHAPALSPRLATSSHIWIPGAPPASKGNLNSPLSSPAISAVPSLSTIPPSPNTSSTCDFGAAEAWDEPSFLPDSSWIAIVCGVSKDQLREQDDSELPERFFVSPRDIYMPDLMAVSDVLLGKLGYGTVSECLDAATPFVYVSRPLFIEEHGLRLLLDREGVGVQLSREAYENGDWASAVQDAWMSGKDAKSRRREKGITGQVAREQAGRDLAQRVVDWANSCWT